jgi:hypothetical protein
LKHFGRCGILRKEKSQLGKYREQAGLSMVICGDKPACTQITIEKPPVSSTPKRNFAIVICV